MGYINEIRMNYLYNMNIKKHFCKDSIATIIEKMIDPDSNNNYHHQYL